MTPNWEALTLNEVHFSEMKLFPSVVFIEKIGVLFEQVGMEPALLGKSESNERTIPAVAQSVCSIKWLI